MRVLLYNGKLLSRLTLPNNIDGIFWLIDEIENVNLLAIESFDDKWIVKSNDDVKIIYNNSYVDELVLYPNMIFLIEINEVKYFVCVEYLYDNSYTSYQMIKTPVTLGIDQSCDIVYQNMYIFNNYLNLYFVKNEWLIHREQNSFVYVNDFLLSDVDKKLNFGDVIYVFGLRIILLNGILLINNPANNIKISCDTFRTVNFKDGFNFDNNVEQSDSIKEIDYYKEGDFFYKKARVRRFIETVNFEVATPPQKNTREDMPVLLVLGPMLTMGMVSVVTFGNVISKISSGDSTVEQVFSQLIMSGSMLMSSLLWPTLTRGYQKKVDKRKEKERRLKYKAYVAKKKKELECIANEQSSIMNENLIVAKDCENIILNKKINLWERRSDQKDFLSVRVGIGNVPIDVDLNFQKQEFSMDDDELRIDAEDTFDALKMLYNVPVSYSFNNKKVTALMSADDDVYTFIDNLLLQLVTFHSYDDLKLIFLTNKNNLDIWNKYSELPHCFSNNRQVRYFANNIDDIKLVSSYLEQEFYNRVDNVSSEQVENENNEKTYSPYYLIITDDYPFVRKVGIIENILKSTENLGFSILCMENKLSRIPSECQDFIHLNKINSTILCTDIEKNSKQMFSIEIDKNINMTECLKVLQNIPIEFIDNVRYLPTSYGFLEMFNVGKVEQLNSFNRWKINDPITSLRARIGVDDEGNPIYLDLHEKYHGPHGLIAGTTGSGKSEFIITYILSMALNYSPEEVAFILIDYKGGGLAGAFENKTQGIRLPHLAGTITNLDKASLNRTLVSIDSELKRRQAKFNEERDKLGESTIDIYKYQRFYREGKIDEPMPHLFIISDEFAELKSQQPEFMDDLISAARIGRSLGIHLILATQKPSGVVNDQIWSNTKFRVCLKVQDASDSNEMLKQTDAAYITNPGRFYLQVGNNEIFVLGQSGWAGTTYVASETIKKKYDRSVSFIDDVGNVIKNLSENVEKKNNVNQGDELSNVLKYICNIADKENLRTKNLWLDSIPEIIFIDDVISKYKFSVSSSITAVVGEYDAPSKQFQDILTVPVDENGNTLVFSTSGTDRELFLSSYIYSLCINYSSDDINIYVIDYGSETFRLYDKFPQVGDVVYPSDGDKLTKLLNLFSDEISKRKKLFADYNGEYKNYIKNSGKKVPVKIMIINNYDSFKDTHGNLEELLIKLSREGERYGLVLLLSLNSSRSIYSRFQLNFHNTYVINMPDKGDYMDIFGKIGNVCPAEYEGRGLFKDEETYEFQTARITDEDHLVEFINEKAKMINTIFKNKAPNIPSLPEEVTIEMLDSSVKDIKALPLGITKKKLNVCTYDFFNDKCTIISSKDVNNCIDLLKTIIYGVRKLNHMVVLIDTEQVLSSLGGIVNTYADKNFEDFILRFENFLDSEIDGKNIKVLCIISGLEKFQGSLNEQKFNGFFKGIKTLDNLNLIFVDSSHKLKKVQYESWFSGVTDNSNGIWVGAGFTEQSVFKCDTYGDMYKININKQFAWVNNDGEADLIKIVGAKEDEE